MTTNKTTKFFLNVFSSVETIIGAFFTMLVNTVINNMTKLTPIAAPIAPAFSVFTALYNGLHTPYSIALLGAAAIEITGMFVAKTSIACHNWNTSRTKSESEAPRSLAISMAAIYFTVIFILSLTIEVNPDLVLIVYPGFVVVAITVYVSLAIANNLNTWEADRTEKQQLSLEKRGVNAELKQARIDLEKAKNGLSRLNDDTEQAQQMVQQMAQQIETLNDQKEKLLFEIDTKQGQLNDLASGPSSGAICPDDTKNEPGNVQTGATLNLANKVKKDIIKERRQSIIDLTNETPDLTQPELTSRLNDLGYDVSLSTVKRDVKQLNGSLKKA